MGSMTPLLVALVAALVQIGGGVLVLVFADRAARLAALGLVANVCAIQLFQDRSNFIDPGHRVLAIDVGFLLWLVVVTLRHQRIWLIVCTALQLLSVTSDAVMLFDRVPAARAWLTVTIGFGWAVFACVLWGGLDGARRRAAKPRL